MNNESEIAAIADYLNTTLSGHPAASTLLPLTTSNLLEKVHDGILFCYLINTLSKQGPVINEATLKLQKPTLFHKLDHNNKALDGAGKIHLEIVNIRAENIVEMKEATIIGFMNQVVRQRPKEKVAQSYQKRE